MKKLTTTLLALVLGFVLATNVSAKGPTAGSWTGMLIDKHCGSMMTGEKATTHDKDCAMKCAKNGKGLGMTVDGKWYSFDKKGETLAWNILKSSNATSNIQVNVDGKVKGNKIAVKKMTEKA